MSARTNKVSQTVNRAYKLLYVLNSILLQAKRIRVGVTVRCTLIITAVFDLVMFVIPRQSFMFTDRVIG